MEQYYYLDCNNQQQGPVDADKLVNYGVKHNTLVWKNGMGDWIEAGRIPELISYFAKSNGVVPPPPPYSSSSNSSCPPSYSQKPDNLLLWSILSTVLCCLPLGIVAIVYSNKVDNLWNAKDYNGARDAAKQAKLFCFLSLGGGLLVGIFYFIIGMIGALA